MFSLRTLAASVAVIYPVFANAATAPLPIVPLAPSEAIIGDAIAAPPMGDLYRPIPILPLRRSQIMTVDPTDAPWLVYRPRWLLPPLTALPADAPYDTAVTFKWTFTVTI